MSAAEVEYLAEFEKILITPNFSAQAYQFIEGNVGPFVPLRLLEVPIWLAVTLKKRNKCTIRPPAWMNTEYIQRLLELEKINAEAFSKVPDHYIEISALLFDCASDDIRDAETVRGLLADLQNIRTSKLRNSFPKSDLINVDLGTLVTTNLTVMEVNTIRPFFYNRA